MTSNTPLPFSFFTDRGYIGTLARKQSHIVIWGAGFSGLTLGAFLKHHGIPLTIVEPGTIGGLIQTLDMTHGLRETAANGVMVDAPGMRALESLLGLSPIYSRPESLKRYIVRRGKMTALPFKPHHIVTSSFLPLLSRLLLLPRMIKFILFGKIDPTDSVFTLIKKISGTASAHILSSAMVAGIYGGNPHDLRVGIAFPRMLVFLAKLKKPWRRQRPAITQDVSTTPKHGLTSYAGGMGALTRALHQHLADHIHTTLPDNLPGQTLHIGCIPAQKLGDILPPSLASISALAGRVHYAPIASLQVFAKKSQFKKLPEGFGVLVPEGERFKMLGALFPDQIFPEHVVDSSMAALNFLYCGTRHPEMITLHDSIFLETALEESRRLFGFTGHFVEHHLQRWPRAIPQYTLELADFWQQSHDMLTAFNQSSLGPQWILFGNYTGQVSLRGISGAAMTLAHALGAATQPQ